MNNCTKHAISGKEEKTIHSNLPKIVLAGNPNVGKSAFFTAFTGTYAEVSNYPGTTVDVTHAHIDGNVVIDTPGIYGIGSYNEEETVARDIIKKADMVINVVSALSLDRDLFLTQQLIDMGFKTIMVLNQTDEAESRGIKIDIESLKTELGINIIPAVATKNIGINETRLELKSAQQGHRIKCLQPVLENLPDSIIDMEESEEKTLIYSERRKRVNEIVEKTVIIDRKNSISETLGGLLLNPMFGAIAAIIILYLMYQIIGITVAGDTVDFLENGILLKYYTPFITSLISKILPSGNIHQILVGEFGLLTMSVQYIVGVLLPLIAGFNIFMAILEDSGYLPRLAVLTDRFLSKIGLNGRAIIPIILGFGCITMATITTRILGTNRERTIATTILGLTIPCSAQLGIIVGLIAAAGGLNAWIIYLVSIFSILALIGTVLNRLLPGESSHLLIDLPPLRLPQFKNIMSKTISKTWHFLEEATPLFLLGSFLISVLQLSSGLNVIEKILAPLTVSILHLPKETAAIFIMGLIRRDFGAAGLAKMAGIGGTVAVLSHLQILVCLVVLTLFVPCIASVVIMFKERGVKEASLIWFGSWVAAFAAGGILSRILGLFL